MSTATRYAITRLMMGRPIPGRERDQELSDRVEGSAPERHCKSVDQKHGHRDHGHVVEGLKEAYGNEQRLQDLADDLNARGYLKAAKKIEKFLPGLMSYTAFPKKHGKRLRTTNMMERVNKELKRRTKVVGVFPNEESLLRLVGSILMDINEEWVTGRRYLTMEKE